MGIPLESKIFVAGHRGLVGSALCRALEQRGYSRILKRTRAELDLQELQQVRSFFERERPDFVILAAAKVGGIGANSTYPVEFLLENLSIQNNVIATSAATGVKKLVFLGSSCIYPRSARYPLTEDQLLAGPFESTNEAYALAKVAGIKLCQAYAREYGKDFISLMPTNLYGPNDQYHLHDSHVIPAMFLKFLLAKKQGQPAVTLWGTGTPLREFLHSDDLASAVVFCLEKYDNPTQINVGSGQEVSIRELAELVAEVCGYQGRLEWDRSKPDGVARKLMDSSRIRALGWQPQVSLREGLRSVLKDAEKHICDQRKP